MVPAAPSVPLAQQASPPAAVCWGMAPAQRQTRSCWPTMWIRPSLRPSRLCCGCAPSDRRPPEARPGAAPRPRPSRAGGANRGGMVSELGTLCDCQSQSAGHVDDRVSVDATVRKCVKLADALGSTRLPSNRHVVLRQIMLDEKQKSCCAARVRDHAFAHIVAATSCA